MEFHDYFTNCFTGLEQVGFTEFVTTLTDSEFKVGLFAEQNTQFFHILGIKIRVFIKQFLEQDPDLIFKQICK